MSHWIKLVMDMSLFESVKSPAGARKQQYPIPSPSDSLPPLRGEGEQKLY